MDTVAASPDSPSLSDSLSSSELELLEAFAWFCPAWPSSSSSSAGVLWREGGGCFSRSCRPIFSLLLIREIEVLEGVGPRWGGTTGGMPGSISEGNHCMCSQLERACTNQQQQVKQWVTVCGGMCGFSLTLTDYCIKLVKTPLFLFPILVYICNSL